MHLLRLVWWLRYSTTVWSFINLQQLDSKLKKNSAQLLWFYCVLVVLYSGKNPHELLVSDYLVILFNSAMLLFGEWMNSHLRLNTGSSNGFLCEANSHNPHHFSDTWSHNWKLHPVTESSSRSVYTGSHRKTGCPRSILQESDTFSQCWRAVRIQDCPKWE